MKTAIVYKTIYGSTKRYADWLSKDLKYPEFEMDSVKISELEKFGRIIVMSGTYAGRMPLTDFLKNNWKSLESKKLVVVAVGAAPEDSWWSKVSYFFVPGYIKERIKYFKIYGQYKNLGEEISKKHLTRVLAYLKQK